MLTHQSFSWLSRRFACGQPWQRKGYQTRPPPQATSNTDLNSWRTGTWWRRAMAPQDEEHNRATNWHAGRTARGQRGNRHSTTAGRTARGQRGNRHSTTNLCARTVEGCLTSCLLTALSCTALQGPDTPAPCARGPPPASLARQDRAVRLGARC